MQKLSIITNEKNIWNNIKLIFWIKIKKEKNLIVIVF